MKSDIIEADTVATNVELFELIIAWDGLQEQKFPKYRHCLNDIKI